ncbi:MAG: DNA double-strand break repair nuclease NurA [Anaerolineales bacterium]|nr:DNA double-strand break repair nuclease NurA [Anaerolineales bacterium]
MPLDLLSVKQQSAQIAANAPQEQQRIQALRSKANELLAEHAEKGAELRAKVELAAQLDSWLRSAKPTGEALSASFALPAAPGSLMVIAADGSQINPDRHAALNFYLVNLGAILMRTHSGLAPVQRVQSELHYAEYSATGSVTQDQVGLERDTNERIFLAGLAAEPHDLPVLALTDGPLELWGSRSQDSQEQQSYLSALDKYLTALQALHAAKAITAGYVDKPRADLVVRALEIAATPQDQLGDARKLRYLRGVTDTDLFAFLAPGERSAIFAHQNQLSARYEGPLALHFFYLNVGDARQSNLARVEVPAWVVEDSIMLDTLHAALVEQCKLLASRPYPYALHRAHEIAVVSRAEKDEVTNMLQRALEAEGVHTGDISHKQALKDLPGRGRN